MANSRMFLLWLTGMLIMECFVAAKCVLGLSEQPGMFLLWLSVHYIGISD